MSELMLPGKVKAKKLPKRIVGDCNHIAFNNENRNRVLNRKAFESNYSKIKWKSR